MKRAVPIYINPSDPSAGPDGRAFGFGTVGYAVNETALPEVHVYRRDGPQQVFGSKRTLGSGFPDGTSATVIVTEHFAKTYYPWQSFDVENPPARISYWHDGDLTRFDKESFIQYNPQMSNKSKDRARADRVQAPRREGILVGMADGSGRLVSNKVTDQTWGYLCDPSDGNVVPDF